MARKPYNKRCFDKDDCLIDLDCRSTSATGIDRCLCPDGHLWDEADCLPVMKPVKTCSNDSDCKSVNGTCAQGQCTCRGLYSEKKGVSKCLSDYRIQCKSDFECQKTFRHHYINCIKPNATAVTGNCGCTFGYQFSYRFQECKRMSDLACIEHEDCTDSDERRHCDKLTDKDLVKKCRCWNGLYEYPKTDGGNGFKCVEQKQFRQECESHDECQPIDSVCMMLKAEKSTPNTTKCYCMQTQHLVAGKACQDKQCTIDDHCKDNSYPSNNVICKNNQCQCADGYVMDWIKYICVKNDSVANQKTRGLLQDCRDNVQCRVPSSLCRRLPQFDNRWKCYCPQARQPDPKKPGEKTCDLMTCAADDDCTDDNYDTKYKVVCKTGHCQCPNNTTNKLTGICN